MLFRIFLAFVISYGICFYDLNHDGIVNEGDMSKVAEHLYCRVGDPCYDASVDFYHRGYISIPDIGVVGSHVGEMCR